MTNYTLFTDVNGWIAENFVDSEDDSKSVRPTISVATYPQINTKLVPSEDTYAKIGTYLYANRNGATNFRIMNSAIGAHRGSIEGIAEGDQWILRVKYKVN
jgi:hypothetical protein